MDPSVLPIKKGTVGGEVPIEDEEEIEDDEEGHAECWFKGE